MPASFSFTKLVVDDLERMAAFYREAFDLFAVRRERERIGDERIDEIMLSPDREAPFGTLVLLKFLDRPRPRGGEAILGFVTEDLPMLTERVLAAGGRMHAEMRTLPELGIRVAFAADPEGHLSELVQVLA